MLRYAHTAYELHQTRRPYDVGYRTGSGPHSTAQPRMTWLSQTARTRRGADAVDWPHVQGPHHEASREAGRVVCRPHCNQCSCADIILNERTVGCVCRVIWGVWLSVLNKHMHTNESLQHFRPFAFLKPHGLTWPHAPFLRFVGLHGGANS